ncbi:hypothetical protein PENSPDRAFT_567944 [Peniophora sp. CONT]|nr:hypothetical protein PENSPDRAFT_567944 [Peniophora sp. CONT]
MASIAFRPATSFSSLFRRFSLSASLAVPAALAPSSLGWSIPSLGSLLELFPPWLLAVPKKKVSHSRKNMRSANKGLKDKLNIVNCPGCGAAKLSHHLCANCYSVLNRKWKGKYPTAEDAPTHA